MPEALPREVDRAQLPDPAVLSPGDATTLGSQLLAGGALEEAFPFLVRGLQDAPTAFGWCRVGKLCRDAGHPAYAVRCYDEALALAPQNRYAVIGRSAVLAESSDASLEELVNGLAQLSNQLSAYDEPAPILWTACAVMRAIEKRWSHPMIRERVDQLRRLATDLDRRNGRDRSHAEERRLDSVLRMRELLDIDGHSTNISRNLGCGPSQPRLLPSHGVMHAGEDPVIDVRSAGGQDGSR